ncbi:MAG: hypothetical protein JXB35_14050 [Anaerolineae bacterium]|nr:hypothetical protein [Anaerolineae bacterium]
MADEMQANAAPEVQSTPAPKAAPSEVGAVSLNDAAAGGGFAAILDRVRTAFQGRGWLVPVIIGVLVLAFLFLPPVSLGARLASGGNYTALDAETPSLTHPDGVTVALDTSVTDEARVRLASMPRADFLAASEDEAVVAARDAVPAYLMPKSPFYTVESKGKDPAPLTLTVVIPNEAEPWETLDLYTWDGTTWRWMPSHLDRDREALVSSVSQAPGAVMVMQTGQPQQAVVAESQDLPAPGMSTLLTYLDLIGMKIGTLGALNGDPALLPPGSISTQPVLVPTVRNWVPDRAPNRGLVADMLAVEADRATHVANLTELATGGAYAGLVVDYRQLASEDRASFTTFISELAASLHEKGAWLAVTVDVPEKTADGWDTAGYDWLALGGVADQIRMVMPLAPQAYAPGGLAEQLIAWSTSQVNRYKLYPIFSTLSTDGETLFTVEDALALLGNVAVSETVTDSVEPGAQVDFRLASGAVIESDPLSGATSLTASGQSIWLGTPQWLRARLDLTARYNVGGVVLRDFLGAGNFPGIDQAVADYEAQVIATAFAAPDVVWQITSPDGQVAQSQTSLTRPELSWSAPEITGTYQVAASIAGLERGMVEIEVSAPVVTAEEEMGVAAADLPEEGEAAEEGEAGEEGAEGEETGEEEALGEGLKAAYVADVTVPDNTKFEKGEGFIKTWRVKNTGNEPWPDNTVLQYISGEKLAAVEEVAVGGVAPGAEIEISVDMTAPDKDGVFESRWALAIADARIPGGALFTIIQAGEAGETGGGTPAPAPAPAPSRVAGGSFELGGHTLQGFTYASTMHYAGMNWVKVQVRYPGDASGIIAAAHANGFKIQVSALGESGMVTQGGFEDTVANWVAGMAAAGADAIEIWNEPNLDREWAYSHMTPQNYTNLLCKSYSSIKAANPNSWVISAAPAPTGLFGGCSCQDWAGQCGCDDQPWLEGLYNAGATNCMDFIGAHHNAGATSPGATTGHPASPGGGHHSWYFLPQTQLYYNIFRGTRQLFYTELGYVSQEGFGWIPDNFAWAANTTVAQQAQWLGEVVSLSAQTGMVRAVIVWNVDAQCYGQCGGMGDPQAGFAIIRPDGSCPACETLHALLGSR